ncbi:histone H1-like [Trifolium pratense]|uniref:histone H1-like n=1 Tax=Trifolium pratense TaxID=57577 RepID=UPI001E694B97|nr:histone H1-like [Trifolium pratense]
MMQDERNKVVMEKLKKSLLFRMVAINPNSSSIINSSIVSSFIDNRFPQVFKSFDAPTHPPYELMIKKAMKELNEEYGSTEEAISGFIRSEYGEDLPCAHTTILHIQLRKLCMAGKLGFKKGKYVLDFENNEPKMTLKSYKKKKMKQTRI